ncbi:hypothetical protein DPMN_054212 [Dreissena polymorpha]|uniref:Uncharacterized protein n=1 Tax=Dreissena polymorpha TaxID=45954 RepID=A0A9D4CPW5_DREPO|nr:hypothetical protein DPMN_054212 [Dreissena polymorpha]
MNMQRIILHKFQKKLDKSEANVISIKSVKKESYAGPNTCKWINEFSLVWEICRQSLEQYACPSEFGLLTVPQGFCTRQINDDMPMSVLLPSTTGPGLCSYIMLDFFFRKQNDFLDNYMRESGRRRDTMQSIKPMAVTSAHLISYDHENDLMPLILANCHYSFEMGVGTKIEYDFIGMERQLIDRLLYSKSRIYIHQYLEVLQTF